MTLNWTPSISAAVVGYTVHYTDNPRQPGYPLSAPAPLPSGATIAELDQSVENPLGEGGFRIHEWAYRLKGFREMHGDKGGGETGTNDDGSARRS